MEKVFQFLKDAETYYLATAVISSFTHELGVIRF